jgi:uncharacterized protein YndB with AHSA1/START domain
VATAPGETSDLQHEVVIEAAPETVFEHLTDPVKFVRWMGTEATLDPRPGGVCRVVFLPGVVVIGEFVEVTPPRRLVFTWGWENEVFAVPPASTEVEVDLIPEGHGTRLHLMHRRIPEVALRFHVAGWDHYTGRLAVLAAGGDPGPDVMPGVADPSLIPGA